MPPEKNQTDEKEPTAEVPSIVNALNNKVKFEIYGEEMLEKRVNLQRQSESFTVDEFRALMGVPNDKLKKFGSFNKHCLQVALAEVNQLMDFHVEIGMVKRGRSVEKLTLLWMKKDDDGMREAAAERERSRIGRKVRREGKMQRIVFEEA